MTLGTRRTIRYAAALAAVAVLTAACSGGGSGAGGGKVAGVGTAEPVGPGDGAGKTVTVWIMEGTNKDAAPFFSDLTAAFKAKTGATLDVQMIPWGSAHDKFTTAIAGGTTPDVAEVGTTWTAEFGQAGALTDLTADVEAAGGTDGLIPGLMASAQVDGKLYGMPWYAGVRSVVYNKDLFAKAGITAPPTTWAELRTDALKLKAAGPGVTAFPVAGDASYAMAPFIWGAGGELATKTGSTWTCGLTSDKARAGLTYYTDLALKDDVSTAAATTWKETDLRDSFIKGQSAMIVSGSWTPAAILAKAPQLTGKLGVFAIPGETGGLAPSFVGGSHLSVFESSKNPDLAWALVKMMGYGDYATKWAKESSFFPGTTSGMAKVTATADPLVTPFAKAFTDAGKSVPVTPAWGKVEGAKTLSAMSQSILSGKATVEQATTTACTEMNKQLASS